MQRWPYQVLGLTCRLTSITYLVAPNQFSCERAREGERKRENTPPENFAKMSKEIKNNKKLPLSHDTRPDDEVDWERFGNDRTQLRSKSQTNHHHHPSERHFGKDFLRQSSSAAAAASTNKFVDFYGATRLGFGPPPE